MSFTNLIQRAFNFADMAHEGQKYGDKEYICHCIGVKNILMDHGFTERDHSHLLAAALLHDVIEDTDFTFDDIVQNFGERIALIVYACTGVGPNRHERNKSQYMKIGMIHEAAPVKCADRIYNMRAATMEKSRHLKSYIDEYRDFRIAIIHDGEITTTSAGVELAITLNEVFKEAQKAYSIN